MSYDPFTLQRDRSMDAVPIPKLEIKQLYKIGMYVCEPCFLKLDKPKSWRSESE